MRLAVVFSRVARSAICRLAFGAEAILFAIIIFIQIAIIAIQHHLVIDRKIPAKMEQHVLKPPTVLR
jgi:hypothetical protein